MMQPESTLTIPRRELVGAFKTVSHIGYRDPIVKDKFVRLTTRDDREGNELVFSTAEKVANCLSTRIDVGADHDCVFDNCFALTPIKRWLSFATGDAITICQTETHMSMSDGRAVARFRKHDPDHVRILPDHDWVIATALSRATLQAILKNVAFCAAVNRSDSYTHPLEHVLFTVANGVLTVQASDGFRMARYQVDAPDMEDRQFQLHSDFIRSLARVLRDNNASEIDVWYEQETAHFHVGTTALSLGLTQRPPAPFDKSVSDRGDVDEGTISLAGWELRSAIQRFRVGSVRGDDVMVDVSPTPDGTLILRCACPGDDNEYEQEVEDCEMTGTIPHFRVNGKWLAEIVARFGRVTIGLRGASNAVRITGDVDGLLYLLMPMHVAK